MADPLVPEVKPRGYFTEEGPTPFGAYAADVLGTPSRDIPAERAALAPERKAAREARRESVGAVTSEIARRDTEAEADIAANRAERATGRAEREAVTRKMTEHAAPDIKARPFLAPGAGVLNQLQAALVGVGALATQIGGLRGSAMPAMLAIKGLAEGYAKGDRERIDNEWTAWTAANKKLIDEHHAAVQTYRDLVEDQTLTAAEKQLLSSVRLKGLEFVAGQRAMEAQDIEGQLKELAAAEDRQQKHVELVKHLEFEKAKTDALQARMDRAYKVGNMAPEVRHYLADVLHVDPATAGDADVTKATNEVKGEKLADEARKRSERKEDKQDVLDVSLMRGGPWVDRKTGQILDNLTRGEWTGAGGHANFKPITKQQQQNIDLLDSEALPQIDQLKLIGGKILARYPGQNLAKMIELEARGKLSDSDVREYNQARLAVALTLTRALGGTSAIRQFILKQIEAAEVPHTGDTAQTMNRMAENSRTAVINFTRGAKGMKPFPMPASQRTVEVVDDATGRIGTLPLKPYEPLPEGVRYHY